MYSHRLFLLFPVFLVLALISCAPRTVAPPALDGGVLAVAAFGQPRHGWEHLSSYRSDHPPLLAPEIMAGLDETLQSLLKDEPGRVVLGPDATRQCQELALSKAKTEGGGLSGLRYWLEVGRCVPADYLLVPQILEWREREGGKWGVNEPAMVVLELTLLDVAHQRIARRHHFEESQQSLSEDLLQARKFFRRGGKWLTTQELVRDGLREGLREMSL
ncbi:MAG TPA: hypothetical protein ENN39_01835 [Desulfonatronum sp.]|nr:hypothetical protein [Desulfonatronum sp.]